MLSPLQHCTQRISYSYFACATDQLVVILCDTVSFLKRGIFCFLTFFSVVCHFLTPAAREFKVFHWID
jgi:hypothetical protein